MIYKLILLKDLPEAEAGFEFFLKGGMASHDGDEWFSWVTRQGIYHSMYSLYNEKRIDWIKAEETDLPDNRLDLENYFPNHELLSFKEALDAQGFLYDDTPFGINNIRCCDNEQLKMLGATKADCIYCNNCGKAIQDAINFLVWGLKDVPSPRGNYMGEYRYDPFEKYIAAVVKDEFIVK